MDKTRNNYNPKVRENDIFIQQLNSLIWGKRLIGIKFLVKI